MNNTSGLDMIEVVLKKDLKIPLNELEEKCLSNIDEQTKQEIFELVNNCAYLDEIKNLVEHIKKTSLFLSVEEQDYIKTKCEERIQNLEHPSLSTKSFYLINNKK